MAKTSSATLKIHICHISGLKLDNEDQDFCAELHKQLLVVFDFILNPEAEDFIDLYYVASYLAPVHKFVIGPSELTIVRKYFEGIDFFV